jgi:diguanylate cyclase (GGDEF)-like protein/hemerythrin-like metal-binding protein
MGFTVDAVDFRVLHGLAQHLGLPLVLFDRRSGEGIANDRFADVYLPGQLDGPGLRRLARAPGSAWQPVHLQRRDGRHIVAYAQAIALADGVLLVFEETRGAMLARDNDRLRKRVAELESLSATDALTGAGNRAQLERQIDVEIRRAVRSGQPVSLILLDVDRFKRVNDRYGHLAGDDVLKEFVGRIRQRSRDTDSLFRWGGEEFAVLATSVGYRGGAALAEGLRRIIAATPFAKVGPITASLGVTEHIEGESAESWFQRTDEALYAAKSAGRNRIHVDRVGSSDLHAHRTGTALLRLYWLEAYECGEPSIDAEHRELFDLGNALIAATMDRHSEPLAWRWALDSMLAHLVKHFRDEEVLLEERGYGPLAQHRHAHAVLLSQAAEVKAAVERGEATLGHLVNFLAYDVIALHLVKTDRDFATRLRGDGASTAARGRSLITTPNARLH